MTLMSFAVVSSVAAPQPSGLVGLVSAVLMLAGATFVLVAAVGLHRFEDVFGRMHAAGKASTLGLGLILAGAAVRIADDGEAAKLALGGLMALVTIPAGVHLIARAAHRSGTEIGPSTRLDELAERRDSSRASS